MKHHTPTSSSKRSKIVEIGLCILILVLLAAIAIPNYVRARTTVSMNSCLFNRMWIESAKRHWAAENRKSPGDVSSEAEILAAMRKITPMWNGSRIYRTKIPLEVFGCGIHAGGYTIGSIGEPIQCGTAADRRWDEHDYRAHYGMEKR